MSQNLSESVRFLLSEKHRSQKTFNESVSLFLSFKSQEDRQLLNLSPSCSKWPMNGIALEPGVRILVQVFLVGGRTQVLQLSHAVFQYLPL